MPIEIKITKKTYAFIDPDTGQELSEEDFAKKYPAVAVGGHRVGSVTKQGQEEAEGNK
jgi:hypothetical protein